MRTCSFRDLLVCEELSHIKNEISLLHPSNDGVMERILGAIGFDVAYPIAYIPSKHRDMQGKVAVGYVAVGEISCNRNFINGKLSTTEDRIIAAGYQDISLARELASLSGQSRSFAEFVEVEAADEESVNYDSANEVEPDYTFVESQIKQLAEIRDTIRGSMYNSWGEVKTLAEYKENV